MFELETNFSKLDESLTLRVRLRKFSLSAVSIACEVVGRRRSRRCRRCRRGSAVVRGVRRSDSPRRHYRARPAPPTGRTPARPTRLRIPYLLWLIAEPPAEPSYTATNVFCFHIQFQTNNCAIAMHWVCMLMFFRFTYIAVWG